MGSMEAGENSPPAPSKTPEPMVTKLGMSDYVGDNYPYAEFHNDPITPLCPPNVRKFAWSDSASFFGFFRQRTAKTPAPIFTIDTSNDVVSRKDVPFRGLENKNLYFEPIFPQKGKILANFWRHLEIFGSKRPQQWGCSRINYP